MDIRHLKHIRALHKYRSFARAAEAINLSQSALSRSVQGLEEQLGAKLFDRNKKNDISPTPAGELVLGHGQKILQQAEQLESELDAVNGIKSGRLKIGIDVFTSESHFSGVVGNLSCQYPKLAIEIDADLNGPLMHKLKEGVLDLVVANSELALLDKELEVRQLMMQTVEFCCRRDHPIFQRDKIFIRDINEYPMIWGHLDANTAYALSQIFPILSEIRRNDESLANVECEDIPVILKALEKSDLISLLPNSIWNDNVNNRSIKPILVRDSDAIVNRVGVIQVKNRTLSSSAQMFFDMLFESS